MRGCYTGDQPPFLCTFVVSAPQRDRRRGSLYEGVLRRIWAGASPAGRRPPQDRVQMKACVMPREQTKGVWGPRLQSHVWGPPRCHTAKPASTLSVTFEVVLPVLSQNHSSSPSLWGSSTWPCYNFIWKEWTCLLAKSMTLKVPASLPLQTGRVNPLRKPHTLILQMIVPCSLLAHGHCLSNGTLQSSSPAPDWEAPSHLLYLQLVDPHDPFDRHH